MNGHGFDPFDRRSVAAATADAVAAARRDRSAALGRMLRAAWAAAVKRWPWLAWVAVAAFAFAPYWHHFAAFWGI